MINFNIFPGQSNYKQTADKFQIIGHSIGAHVAGEVGSKISGLARITGKPNAHTTPFIASFF